METIPTHLFEDALIQVTRLHAGQLRKGTHIPYVAHLLAVSSLVMTHGGNEDEAIAGLLHGAVQHHGGRPALDTIRARFGERVAAIVEDCTEEEAVPRLTWRERKQRYLQRLQSASRSVKLVTAAAKLDNVRSIIADFRMDGAVVWERFNAGPAEQRWFYRACVTALQGAPVSIVRELDIAVRQLEQLEEKGPTSLWMDQLSCEAARMKTLGRRTKG